MKMKVKFDKDAVLTWLTTHVEKIVFGIFMLLFLMLCWAALKQKPYDKRPEEVKQVADQVRSMVEGSTFDPAKDVPPIKELPHTENVSDLVWVARKSWNEPLFEVGKRRPEPKFLPLVDVRVATAYGALPVRQPGAADAAAEPGRLPAGPGGAAAMGGGLPKPGGGGLPKPGGGGLPKPGAAPPGGADADHVHVAAAAPPAGSDLKGMQWAVVTGLVPLQQQSKEYRAVFRDVRHVLPDQDTPHYHNYQVERAEVPPGTVGEGELKWAPVDVKATQAQLALIAEMEPDVVDPMFTDPLLTQPLPRIIGRDKEHGKTVVHPKIPLGPQEGSTGAPAQFISQTPTAAPAGRGLSGIRGIGGGMGSGGAPGEMGTIRATTSAPLPKIEYKLFRFFDFTVQPGKSYCYRVRLVLDNPNYAVPAQYLVNGQLAKGATREAPWSDPSPSITIPRGANLLAGPVKRASGLNDQRMEVVVRMWDPKEAVDAARTAELVRGQVANFPAEEVLVDAQSGPATKKIAFQTDTLVVDMAGGDLLPGGRVRPGPTQMLVLEPNGQLSVKSELVDADTYEPTKRRLKEMQDSSKPAPARDESASDEDRPRRRQRESPADSIFNMTPGGPAGAGAPGGLRGAAQRAGAAKGAPRDN